VTAVDTFVAQTLPNAALPGAQSPDVVTGPPERVDPLLVQQT
jgi:hypothetical protein